MCCWLDSLQTLLHRLSFFDKKLSDTLTRLLPPLASTGRYEDAILTSALTRERFPYNTPLHVYCGSVTARCLAAQGRLEDARREFDGAIAESHRTKSFFAEMLAVRDRWISLDPTGPHPVAALGRAVAGLEAQQFGAYNQLLGHGFDAAAALATQ